MQPHDSRKSPEIDVCPSEGTDFANPPSSHVCEGNSQAKVFGEVIHDAYDLLLLEEAAPRVNNLDAGEERPVTQEASLDRKHVHATQHRQLIADGGRFRVLALASSDIVLEHLVRHVDGEDFAKSLAQQSDSP